MVESDRKYPARPHARRVCELLAEYRQRDGACSPEHDASSAAFILWGASESYWPDCDQTIPFRQDRFFYYLSGASIPGCAVLYDIHSKKLTLYLPDVNEDDVMWSGMPMSLEEAARTLDADSFEYMRDLSKDIQNYEKLYGVEPSPMITRLEVCCQLKEAIEEARVIKDLYEISLMKRAAEITDKCHVAVMSAMDIEHNEAHIHAEFVYHAMRQGAKSQAYDPICGSGPSCGTLHYVKNDQNLDDKQLVLIDAGAEWSCYASDVTRVFPISGHWSKEARQVYDTVLRMQKMALSSLRAGVQWEDLHKLSHEVLVSSFQRLGILRGEFSIQELMDSRVSVAFYPHGLGHMLGMNTHDTGGHPNYNDPDPMFQYLRIRRKLLANMVVTVEPGAYFNPFLIENYIVKPGLSKYVDFDTLERYMSVGGVRIEDDILVLENGFENLTKVTSDPDEVARVVRNGLARKNAK